MFMKNLSQFASRNVLLSRVLIVFLHFLLVFNALQMGVRLFYLDVLPVGWVPYLAAAGILALYHFYPRRKEANFHPRRRYFDGGFVILMTVLLSGWYHGTLDRTEQALLYAPAQPEFMVLEDRKIPPGAERGESRGIFKRIVEQQRRWRAKLVKRKQVKKARKSGATFGYILFGVILSVLILWLMLGLSCSLSCAGQEALGFLVLLGGVAIIVGLWFLIARQVRSYG